MIEKELFAGLVEAKFSSIGNYMDIEACALYQSKNDRYGNCVDCINTMEKMKRNCCPVPFILGSQFYSTNTAFARVFLEGTSHWSSKTESDVYQNLDDGDEEYEETLQLNADIPDTFFARYRT